MFPIISFALTLIIGPATLMAGPAPTDGPTFAGAPLAAMRTDTPPTIDGILDDAVWQGLAPLTGFTTFTPDFGQPLAERTEVLLAYDADHLYFAFRCFDSRPDQVKASLAKRDAMTADDWVCINLDSFNDQQALYGLYINPLGIQGDTRYAAGKEDDGFDMVWDSAGRTTDTGYVIEVAIPLKSIRFAGRERVEMGIIFERRISRLSQQGTWPALAAAQGASFLTQMQTFTFDNLHQERIFELLPAVTYNHRQSRREGRLQDDARDEDLSLTAKLGLTSQLILDATYNPDFNQVEADAGQVDINLRSPLFFQEKRPFFQEGAETFNLADGGLEDPLFAVLHTRNIVDPLAGLKLGGKIGKRQTVALLAARDEVDPDNPDDFTAFRTKRTLHGDGFVGAFYTGREDDTRRGRLLGVDGSFRLTPASKANVYALGSRREEDGTDDADGHAVSANYNFSNRNKALILTAQEISEDFRADTGFLFRSGIRRLEGYGRINRYPQAARTQRLQFDLYAAHTRDLIYDRDEHAASSTARIAFDHTRNASVRFSHNTEIFLGERFRTGGLQLSFSDRPGKTLSYSLSYRDQLAIFYAADPFQGRERRISGDLTWQPTDQLEWDLTYTRAAFDRDDDGSEVYRVPISRSRLTYQVNRYLFFRGILEHNGFREELLTDLLASFTYIPGTVMHLGYGSLYRRADADSAVPENLPTDRTDYLETQRGFFFKASYRYTR